MSRQIIIRWSGTIEDDADFDEPFAKDHEFMVGEWADCEANSLAAVGDLVESYVRGCDNQDVRETVEQNASLLIEIHEPQSIAGLYTVALETVVKASVRKQEN